MLTNLKTCVVARNGWAFMGIAERGVRCVKTALNALYEPCLNTSGHHNH